MLLQVMKCAMLSLVLFLGSSSNAENWAVHVPMGISRANKIAEDHGLLNHGEVIPDSKIFHFSYEKSSRRSKRSPEEVELVHQSLSIHPEVSEASIQSEGLKRVKRIPIPTGDLRRESGNRELCFINTIRDEEREPKRCVFPFKYKQKTYVKCTADHSTNGKEWCATEVRPDGEVIHGQWGDCDKKTLSCFVYGETQGQSPLSPQRPQRPPPPPQRTRLPPPRRPSQQFDPRFPPPPPGQGQFRAPPRGGGGGFPPGFPAPPRGQFPPQRGFPQPPPQGRLPPGYPPQGGGRLPTNIPSGAGNRQFPFVPPRQPAIDLVENEVDQKPVNLSAYKTYLTDKSWPKMWFLNRGGDGMDMNVEEAWKQGFSGKGVKVTILDDGVEHTHDDLKENYDPESSIDLNDNDKDPFPRYDFFNSNKHGTRCAGTVSARANNSFCAVGIAYDSKIGGVRILDGQILDVLEARALSFARDHIDIYSASWGPDDNGRTVDGPGDLARRAIADGAMKGRNGKGSIFVWASGNGGKHLDSCGADGYATSIYTLSVSSASENGLIPWYSESCASSIATTYSSGSKRLRERKVVTTDLHGKCTDQHTGTSASSPMAAGIIALALEANPDLTWRDVQHITIRCAKPEGNLKTNDWASNGVGLRFSHAFGFGLMNAGKMTSLAKNWETVPERQECTTAKNALKEPFVIATKKEEAFSLNAAACSDIKFLEHVQLHINLQTRSKRGDLTVMLRSPHKTVSILLPPRPFDNERTGLDKFEKWPMMSVHFWGEPVVKDGESKWYLQIKNDGDRPATLVDFQITFHGTKSDPQPGTPIEGFEEPEPFPLKPIKLETFDESSLLTPAEPEIPDNLDELVEVTEETEQPQPKKESRVEESTEELEVLDDEFLLTPAEFDFPDNLDGLTEVEPVQEGKTEDVSVEEPVQEERQEEISLEEEENTEILKKAINLTPEEEVVEVQDETAKTNEKEVEEELDTEEKE